MAEAPYRFIDRRSKNRGSGNALFEGARRSVDRKWITPLDGDTHRNVSDYGRRQLMTLGRWLFANLPIVRGAVLEQANLSVSCFTPQFMGEDKEWGRKAAEWLCEWYRIMDIRGWPYDAETYRQSLIVGSLVDGDIGTLLTETPDGYPLVQVIPGHRICAPASTEPDPLMSDGVRLDAYGRPVSYRVSDGDESEKFYPSSGLFLTYSPASCDQFRGISALASAVFDLQDIREFQRLELIQQKLAASIGLIENNESGTVDPTKAVIQGNAEYDTTTNQLTSVTRQSVDGVEVRYFRAGTNSSLEALKNDRPTANQHVFYERIIRAALTGLEWSVDFSYDSTKIGGASMRVVVDKINRTIAKRQRMVKKACRRVDGYAIAKAIKLGLLPPSEEWYMWDYQVPARLTADAKYDSELDIEEYNQGFTTLARICGARGTNWEQTQDQWLMEKKRLQDKAREMGVEIVSTNMGQTAAAPEPEEAEPEDEPAADEETDE